MTSEKLDEKAIFNVARGIESADARAEYLRQACGAEVNLIERVETLLRGYEERASFLESPAADLTPTTDLSPIAERPGTVIGPYKLLQQIGEGGMGVVFMAEQSEPIQRIVALKIIKPGMDTRQVIARFEAERQAVAMMDHPNIAKVLDAGTTASGRPYFVMELVKGVPITKYCDEKQLPLRARLELFAQVCQAVQHAHQKGIIHRDIKPNNVLVAEYDNSAVPKVIDFGVAKATAQRLTERTMFTEFGQVLGTMEYMSPEQSKFNQLDIDTRSDIYSLGVLLYELLAGSTPFEGKRLHAAAFDEMLRIIREEEPPKPSTRLSSLSLGVRADSHPLPLGEGRGEGALTLASIAANRHSEPARLSKDVRGELDWIVMKALEKDRNRRYETASGFAADIERHLHHEPVEAGPPSAMYRLRKFARRYRGALVAAVLVFAALVVGIAVSTWQAVRATRAEQHAIAERDDKEAARREAVANARHTKAVSDFLVKAFRSTSPVRNGRTVTVAEVLDQAANELHEKVADDPLTEGALLHAIGESYRALALYDDAILQLEKARVVRTRTLGRQHPETIRCVHDLGWAYIVADRPNQALPLFEENSRLVKDNLDPKHLITLECAYDLAVCYFDLGRQADSLKLIEKTVALQDTTFGRNHRETLESMFELARNYAWVARSDEAAKLYQEVIKLSAKHPDAGVRLLEMEAKEGLARVYAQLGRLDESQVLIEDAVNLFEKWLGPEHRGTRNAKEGLASIYAELVNVLANDRDIQNRDPARALQLARRAVEVDPNPSRALQSLGWAEYRLGRWQASIDALQKSCELTAGGSGGAFQWFFLAMARQQLGQNDEARTWYDNAVVWMDKNQLKNEELIRFRAEAAELLGISRPQPVADKQAAGNETPSIDNPTRITPSTTYD